MAISAFVIGAAGFFIGLLFRLKALLPVVGLLLAGSVVFAVMSNLPFGRAALVTLFVQIILQGSYVAGVVVRGLLARSGKGSPVF